TNLDIFNRTFHAIHDNVIANLERFTEQNQHAREQVLENILEGKTDRDRTNPEGTHQLTRGKARNSNHQPNQNTKENNKGTTDTVEYQYQILAGIRAVFQSFTYEKLEDFGE